MAIAATAPSEHASWRAKRKKRKQDYKAEYRARMTILLQHTRLGYHWYTWLCKLVMLFPPCFILSSFIVKGGYDWAWETGVPLVYLGIGYISFGILLPTWRICRARRRGYDTSIRTWIFVGFLAITLGVICIASAYLYHGVTTTNTDWWHHYAHDKEKRDDFGRNGPEGLYSGLLLGYAMWDPVKYELKGTWADRFFRLVHWPNSFEDDDTRPFRWWMDWVCAFVMLVVASSLLYCFWLLWVADTSHSAAIHAWLRREIPWQWHSSLPGTIETKVNHVANLMFDHWWFWLGTFIGGAFFARLPAKGLINLLQEGSAQNRLVKKGGSLSGTHSWWRSMGWNARVAIEYYEAAAKYLQPSFDKPDSKDERQRIGLSAAQLAVIKAALAQVTRSKVEASVVQSAQHEIDNRDPGVLIPFKLVAWASIVFFPLGGWTVYIHPHLHAIAQLFSHGQV